MKRVAVRISLKGAVVRAAMAAAAAVYIWCFADNLLPYIRENGSEWVLEAAGVEAVRAAEPSEVPEEAESSESTVENALLSEQDGVFDIWSEPDPPAVPESGRETGRVEVLTMSKGKQVDCFTVKDETGTGLDLEAELMTAPDITVKKDGSPVILLYSTHTTESYIQQDGADWYYLDDPFRTLDADKSVVSVAAAAARVIEEGGFGVIHDTTVHDSPAYTGSYSRSMETIQKNLNEYPSISITVDVHRDAFGESGTTRYKPIAEINGKSAAQIMILTGCDLSENPIFPDWRENLRLALRVQQAGESMFPGLYRSLYFCRRNYNMHATHGSLLVEVGTDVNTLSEAQYSGRLLGETLLKVLNELAAQNEAE